MTEVGRIEPVPNEDPSSDGRRRRSQRSREQILHAIAKAIAEPDFEPTPEQVAARSGYSISTILRHFGDRDGLATAMRELVRSRVDEHLAAGPFEGDVRSRVAELVRRLTAVYETVAPFLRNLERSRNATRDLELYRNVLDRLVRGLTSSALGDALASQPEDTPDLLAVVLSQAAWRHMRITQGLAADRAAGLLEAAALRLLGEES